MKAIARTNNKTTRSLVNTEEHNNNLILMGGRSPGKHTDNGTSRRLLYVVAVGNTRRSIAAEDDLITMKTK